MFPGDMLILAGVFKQKFASRTKRPDSAKLSDKTRRAKVGKHNATPHNASFGMVSNVIILILAGLLMQKLKHS